MQTQGDSSTLVNSTKIADGYNFWVENAFIPYYSGFPDPARPDFGSNDGPNHTNISYPSHLTSNNPKLSPGDFLIYHAQITARDANSSNGTAVGHG